MLSFAIAVPHLNQAHLLPTALKSLRYQKVPLKVALMDGGSQDSFQQVADRYEDIVTLVRSGRDLGQADAVQKGLSSIDGDIVAWLNADDYYFPLALEKVSALFEEFPEVDVIYGDAVHVNMQGMFLSYFPGIEDFDFSRLTKSCFICQPACFVRRKAYEEVGGLDISLVYTMDWDLWCRLAARGMRFRRAGIPFAAVRYYPETKTMSGDKARYMEIWRIQRVYGRSIFPWSWPGFYWFDLSFKEDKTLRDRLIFALLQGARAAKKLLAGKSVDLIYGFRRWEKILEGEGVIHLPWYGDMQIRGLLLRVFPGDEAYEISVNGEEPRSYSAMQGVVNVPVLGLNPVSLTLAIRCLSSRVWELHSFSCELA